MPYDLQTRGFADFARLENVLDQQTISRDPLSGVLDGVNKVFHTNYFPILTSGSLGIYVDNALVPGTANYDTGEVVLTSVPASLPFASYTFTPFTATQISQFTIQGFLEMENNWTRGWQLLDATGNWADETSANIFILDANGQDPACGNTVFSNSRVQIGFFINCCEFRFMMTQYRRSARTDFMWRESVRGMTVDKSKRPQNINLAMDDMRDQIARSLEQAEIQFYPAGDQFGGAVTGPVTLDYVGSYEWQTASRQGDFRSLEGYNVAWRPLTYYP